jgi:hypothetical protein
LFDRRAYGPENLYSVLQKEFCNKICQQRKSAALFDDPVRELQNFKTSLTPV